jgi:hypothetical protein
MPTVRGKCYITEAGKSVIDFLKILVIKELKYLLI